MCCILYEYKAVSYAPLLSISITITSQIQNSPIGLNPQPNFASISTRSSESPIKLLDKLNQSTKTITTKAIPANPTRTTFLTLPHELRQQILFQTYQVEKAEFDQMPRQSSTNSTPKSKSSTIGKTIYVVSTLNWGEMSSWPAKLGNGS